MSGVALIAAERRRQVESEGWTPEHDSGHAGDHLARAAACYAMPADLREHRQYAADSRYYPGGKRPSREPNAWPWEPLAWKPTPDDRVRELVKAGALIAAEIDRLSAVDGAEPCLCWTDFTCLASDHEDAS